MYNLFTIRRRSLEYTIHDRELKDTKRKLDDVSGTLQLLLHVALFVGKRLKTMLEKMILLFWLLAEKCMERQWDISAKHLKTYSPLSSSCVICVIVTSVKRAYSWQFDG